MQSKQGIRSDRWTHWQSRFGGSVFSDRGVQCYGSQGACSQFEFYRCGSLFPPLHTLLGPLPWQKVTIGNEIGVKMSPPWFEGSLHKGATGSVLGLCAKRRPVSPHELRMQISKDLASDEVKPPCEDFTWASRKRIRSPWCFGFCNLATLFQGYLWVWFEGEWNSSVKQLSEKKVDGLFGSFIHHLFECYRPWIYGSEQTDTALPSYRHVTQSHVFK